MSSGVSGGEQRRQDWPSATLRFSITELPICVAISSHGLNWNGRSVLALQCRPALQNPGSLVILVFWLIWKPLIVRWQAHSLRLATMSCTNSGEGHGCHMQQGGTH